MATFVHSVMGIVNPFDDFSLCRRDADMYTPIVIFSLFTTYHVIMMLLLFRHVHTYIVFFSLFTTYRHDIVIMMLLLFRLFFDVYNYTGSGFLVLYNAD